MSRIAFIILLLPLASANCFGQSSYKGLTQGKNTRADVERVLGQPTSQLSERLCKYTKDGRQIFVQYRKNSPTAITEFSARPRPQPKARRADIE